MTEPVPEATGERTLFEALEGIHQFDELESLLQYIVNTVTVYGGWRTALVTFYFENDVHFAVVGCPEGTRERFREGFKSSTPESRRQKREQFSRYQRPGTNICFVPEGEGPTPAKAYIRAEKTGGSWRPDDRLVILMRDWDDEIIGVLSLDNPLDGNRPDEEDWRRLGEIDKFVNMVGKIAENRFWSLRLKESEEAYRAIFDAASDGLFILDLEGRIVEANPAGAAMHGYGRDELVGTDIASYVHPDSRTVFADFLSAAAASRETARVEGRKIRKDGSLLDVEARGALFTYRHRPHVLVVVRDVTEQKRIFEHLLQQQKEQSVIAVAGGVAHDFNNVLVGITGSISLLKPRLEGTEDEARLCHQIETSAERLRSLTSKFLSIAGGVQSEPVPTRLTRLITDAVTLLQGVARTKVAITVVVQEDLWPVKVDRVQMDQVLLNLCLNACEAISRRGKLTIRAENVVREEEWECPRTGLHPPGEYVRVIVEDDGCGMEPEVQARIFDLYYSTKASGRGLGLSAVVGILERHGGSIDLASRPGEGTRIELNLPRCREPVPVEEAEEPPVTVAGGGRTVLLVDDENLVRDVAGEMLKQLGFTVLTARTGPEAIELFRERHGDIDLVLLDVQMPGMSGVEASIALTEVDSSVPIVLASGQPMDRVERDLGGRCEVAGYLQKPFTLKTLTSTLKAAESRET